MSIKINIHPVLYHLTEDQKSALVEGETVGRCLEALVARYPEVRPGLFDDHGKLLSYVEIYVNGESAYPDELAKPVTDGDELQIVLILAGG
ncbi:MoaD/ThiS family protein [Chloroflexota bacterium]